MKILVCDDEPAVTEYISCLLEMEGHEVETSIDGGEALEKIQAKPSSYDVLITDHRMPKLTGVELIESVRALNAPLKMMLISGMELADIPMAYQTCMDCFLKKPFKSVELIECLNDLVCEHAG